MNQDIFGLRRLSHQSLRIERFHIVYALRRCSSSSEPSSDSSIHSIALRRFFHIVRICLGAFFSWEQWFFLLVPSWLVSWSFGFFGFSSFSGLKTTKRTQATIAKGQVCIYLEHKTPELQKKKRTRFAEHFATSLWSRCYHRFLGLLPAVIRILP
jgi:hypothetical protein